MQYTNKKFTNIVFLTVLISLMIVTHLKAQNIQNDSKPNIIFILADDLGYGSLGSYGQKMIRTPNIDKLAEEGIRFTQAYAGGPVCTPSRSVLMTGLHNGHTPARDNVPHYHTYLQNNDTTIAEILKDAGYRTGGVGKWSLGDAGTVGRATNQGFDMWLGYLNQDHAHYYYTDYLDLNEGKLKLPGNTILRDHYAPNVLTKAALQFIQQSKDVPFFLYLPFILPHQSAESEDIDRFAVPSTQPYTYKDWPRSAKKYAAMIHILDHHVGQIVKLIDNLELKKNTLIIFTSDNGAHEDLWKDFDVNAPLRGNKSELYEGGIRIPFIARWPGEIPVGKVSDEIISFQDMMPTFAELAGGESPSNIDGTSIVSALKGGTVKTPHKYLYWDFGHTRKRYDQAARMDHWKGIRQGSEGKVQLYDLNNDVGEKNDISALHPKIVKKIDSIMKGAVVPSKKYPIGELDTSGPIWIKNNSTKLFQP